MPDAGGRDPEIVGADEPAGSTELPGDGTVLERGLLVDRQKGVAVPDRPEERVARIVEAFGELTQGYGGEIELEVGVRTQKAMGRTVRPLREPLPLRVDQEGGVDGYSSRHGSPGGRSAAWAASSDSSRSPSSLRHAFPMQVGRRPPNTGTGDQAIPCAAHAVDDITVTSVGHSAFPVNGLVTALLRSFVNLYLTPLSVTVLLLLAATALLWRPTAGLSRRARRARLSLTLGLLLLLAFSLGPLPRALLGSLEDDYAPYTPGVGPEPEWIVVLCGGSLPAGDASAVSTLSGPSLLRLAEAVRITGRHPDARLFLTGGAPPDGTPCGELLRDAALELGVEAGRISHETSSRNTEQEAAAIAEAVGDDPFVLVTSASHMPRAMGLVRARGLDPVAAPAGARVPEGASFWRGLLAPHPSNLVSSDMWVHEVLGTAWARLRGRM